MPASSRRTACLRGAPSSKVKVTVFRGAQTKPIEIVMVRRNVGDDSGRDHGCSTASSASWRCHPCCGSYSRTGAREAEDPDFGWGAEADSGSQGLRGR